MGKWQWLAEIAVPIGNEEFEISTGVPVSSKLVLTTAHGVPADFQTDIQVRFINDFQNNYNWRTAHTVWYCLEDDAALIVIDEVKELLPFIYSTELPDTTTSWEGNGFPCAGKVKSGDLSGERNSIGLNGKYLPGGNQISQDLELTVEAPPAEANRNWKGISGSPVVIEGKLVGIIKSQNNEFKGNRLNGVPFAKLLSDDTFRKILGIDRRKRLLDSVKNEAKKILDDNKEALSFFCKQFSITDNTTDITKIVDSLVDMDIDHFLQNSNSAHRKAIDDKNRIVVERILGLILPALFDPGCIESVRNRIKQGFLCPLPIATRTVTEIIMAGVDCRPVDFRMPVSGEDFPVGAPLIETAPEGGMDLQGESAFIDAFDKHMFALFTKGEDHKLDAATKRLLVNKRLRYIADLAQRTDGYHYRYYFVYQEPSEKEENLKQTIEQLRINYPQLFFISLTPSNALLIAERDLCWPLSDIYKSAKGTPGYGKTYDKAG